MSKDKTKKIVKFMSLVPVRAPVEVERNGDTVVLIYPKDFKKFEKILHKYIGGPDVIRRPLDEMGTFVWDLCDGKHTIGDIVRIMDERFAERIEPAGMRVTMFLETLLKTGLITLKEKKENNPRRGYSAD